MWASLAPDPGTSRRVACRQTRTGVCAPHGFSHGRKVGKSPRFIPLDRSGSRVAKLQERAIGVVTSMFFCQAMSNRLAAVCIVFTMALAIAPQVDIPGTAFDEANTPTNEMVVEKSSASRPNLPSIRAVVPRMVAQPATIDVGRILPIFPDRLTDSRTFRELFCTFLC